jgi:hypothetical protein
MEKAKINSAKLYEEARGRRAMLSICLPYNFVSGTDAVDKV